MLPQRKWLLPVFLVAGILTCLFLYQCILSFSIYVEGIAGITDLPHRHSPTPEGGILKERIPRILHQTWKNTDLSTYPMEASHQEWLRVLPHFKVKLWTDQDVQDLIEASYPALLPTFLGYPYHIQRADIARYVILHHEGGFYADLDCGPADFSLDRLLDAQLVLVATHKEQALSNHFIGAERGSPLLELALKEAPFHDGWIALPYLRVFSSTGPLFLTRMMRQFFQLHKGETPPDMLFLSSGEGNSFCFHRAGRSWHGVDVMPAPHLLLFTFGLTFHLHQIRDSSLITLSTTSPKWSSDWASLFSLWWRSGIVGGGREENFVLRGENEI